MKVGLKISFEKNSLEGGFYLNLFDKYIKFEPYSFRKNRITKAWDEKKQKKLIASIGKDDSFGIINRNYDIFSSAVTGTKSPHRSVTLIQNQDMFLPSNEEIAEIICREGFIVAYLYDEDYIVVQNTSHADNYSQRKISSTALNSIKNIPYKINEFGSREYNIENNPGRMDLIGYCWLLAAWKMWFGQPFFKIVPKQKVLDFPDAYEIRELEDGKIFVQLFEKIDESASAINIEKQRKCREWLQFEKLIEEYK